MIIYKVLRSSEWAELQKSGSTHGAPIDLEDGYIHFSTKEQLAETLEKHFAGIEDLELLAAESDTLAPIKWEPSRGGALFPHLYGALQLRDISWHCSLNIVNGVHTLPELV